MPNFIWITSLIMTHLKTCWCCLQYLEKHPIFNFFFPIPPSISIFLGLIISGNNFLFFLTSGAADELNCNSSGTVQSLQKSSVCFATEALFSLILIHFRPGITNFKPGSVGSCGISYTCPKCPHLRLGTLRPETFGSHWEFFSAGFGRNSVVT